MIDYQNKSSDLLKSLRTFCHTISSIFNEKFQTLDYKTRTEKFHDNFMENKLQMSPVFEYFAKKESLNSEYIKVSKSVEDENIKKAVNDANFFIEDKLIYCIKHYLFLWGTSLDEFKIFSSNQYNEEEKIQDSSQIINQQNYELSLEIQEVLNQEIVYYKT